MPLNSIGHVSVHNGGSFAIVGFTTGLILPFLEIFSLFWACKFYACGYLFHAFGHFITRAHILLLKMYRLGQKHNNMERKMSE